MHALQTIIKYESRWAATWRVYVPGGEAQWWSAYKGHGYFKGSVKITATACRGWEVRRLIINWQQGRGLIKHFPCHSGPTVLPRDEGCVPWHYKKEKKYSNNKEIFTSGSHCTMNLAVLPSRTWGRNIQHSHYKISIRHSNTSSMRFWWCSATNKQSHTVYDVLPPLVSISIHGSRSIVYW